MIIICEICGRTPCHPACPNAAEPDVIGVCEECGESIREDYSYYVDNDGNKFCDKACAMIFHGIKETEWDEYY